MRLNQPLGYHKGYRGIRHERTVIVYTGERWVVEDKLTSKEPHTYRLHWLLPDWEWDVEFRDSGFELRLNSPFGWVGLHISTTLRFPNNDSHITLIRAGETIYGKGQSQPFEGWVSPTYGVKEPALSLVFIVSAEHGVKFVSQFSFPAG